MVGRTSVCASLLSFFVVSAGSSCASPETKDDIVYDARFGDETAMDVWLPSGDSRRNPAVLMIHGGGWRAGSKDHFAHAGRRLAASGYVAASIEYRLLPAGTFPKNAQDCICALAFLRAHADDYRVDPDRIVVMGYSAGAHLASIVGVAADDPEIAPDCEAAGGRPVALPAAVISASGPQDMRLFWEGSKDKESVEEIVGGSPDRIPHAYELSSPRWFVRPGLPPFLLLEDAVSFGGISEMRDDLGRAGVDARLLKVAGSLHVLEQHEDPGVVELGMASETPEAWIAIDDFLARTVGRPR